jgi:archaellum component FlaC
MNNAYDQEIAPVTREIALEQEILPSEILLKISESLNRIDQNLEAAHQSIKKIDKEMERIDQHVTHPGIS